MDDGQEDSAFKSARGFFEASTLFNKMCADFAAKMAASGTAFSPDQSPPEVAREVRAAMFQAWSEYCDQFMRSPAFLELVKNSLNHAIDMRKQLNEFVGRVHDEFQGTSRQEIDQLMQGLRHLEQRMTDEFAEISSRLQGLEEAFREVQASPRRSATAKGKPGRNTDMNKKSKRKVKRKKRQG